MPRIHKTITSITWVEYREVQELNAGSLVWGVAVHLTRCCSAITEGWLEIDKHYSLELCFSIEIT